MDKKYRYSRQREVILEVLKGTTSHPTAERVYEEARKRLPRMSLGTVYRNLKFLAEKGDIQELDLGTSLSSYDGNTENHPHFLCQSCGRVMDIDFPTTDEVNERVAQSTGLKVLFHKLTFYGVCLDCQGKQQKKKGG